MDRISIISTRSAHYSYVAIVADNDSIFLFVKNGIQWIIQFIQLRSFSESACNNFIYRCTRFSSNNTIVASVRDINAFLIIIDMDIRGFIQLIKGISTSDSRPILLPFHELTIADSWQRFFYNTVISVWVCFTEVVSSTSTT
jgi:hypothetical protein